jgi:hypothetical protein
MQNKIQTAQIQERHWPMCKLPKTWAHGNYCHLKPGCQMRRQSPDKPVPPNRKSEEYALNYMACMVCKELEKNPRLSLRPKIHTRPTQIKQTYTQPRSNLRPNNAAELSPHKYRRVQQQPNTTANRRNTRIKKKHDEKPI